MQKANRKPLRLRKKNMKRLNLKQQLKLKPKEKPKNKPKGKPKNKEKRQQKPLMLHLKKNSTDRPV